MKNKILGLFLLTTSSGLWSCDYTARLAMNDLEFYTNALSCLQGYFYCTNTIKPTNKSVNCLQNSACNHLGTLEALASLPYVQNHILSPQQKTDLNKLLITYGKYNLEQLIEEYPANITSNLIDALMAVLNSSDLKKLTDANMQPIPPAGFVESDN
jgi:hypothetical protein